MQETVETKAITLSVTTDEKQLTILKELSAVMHRTDTFTYLTFTGTIRGEDIADSSNSMVSDFCYTRQGDIGYYRLGGNEMISLKDAYITISADIRQIFLSPPREVVNPIRLSIDTTAAVLGKEGYRVTRREKGSLTEILLQSNTHATCREYRALFDSAGFIRQTDMRMTDPSAPADKSRDKLLHVTISHWEPGRVKTELLRMDRYVNISNGVVMPAARLRGYELIRTIDVNLKRKV